MPWFIFLWGYILKMKEMIVSVNLVLLGKTGAGKSASGNTILGREAFKSEKSPESVTRDITVESGTVGDFLVTVYDTPGLFNTHMSDDEILHMINEEVLQRCVSGRCVFLLVIKADRFTEEERKTVEKIEKLLGEKRLKKTWILFTGGDQLEENTMTIKKFLDDNETLKKLIQKYDQRYHVFNNSIEGDTTQVQKLLDAADHTGVGAVIVAAVHKIIAISDKIVAKIFPALVRLYEAVYTVLYEIIDRVVAAVLQGFAIGALAGAGLDVVLRSGVDDSVGSRVGFGVISGIVFGAVAAFQFAAIGAVAGARGVVAALLKVPATGAEAGARVGARVAAAIFIGAAIGALAGPELDDVIRSGVGDRVGRGVVFGVISGIVAAVLYAVVLVVVAVAEVFARLVAGDPIVPTIDDEIIAARSVRIFALVCAVISVLACVNGPAKKYDVQFAKVCAVAGARFGKCSKVVCGVVFGVNGLVGGAVFGQVFLIVVKNVVKIVAALPKVATIRAGICGAVRKVATIGAEIGPAVLQGAVISARVGAVAVAGLFVVLAAESIVKRVIFGIYYGVIMGIFIGVAGGVVTAVLKVADLLKCAGESAGVHPGLFKGAAIGAVATAGLCVIAGFNEGVRFFLTVVGAAIGAGVGPALEM